MRVLVCVKQVLDSAAAVVIDSEGQTVESDGALWSLSPYDEYAIELALTLKDANPEIEVDVVSVGPARSTQALRQAVAMGCDGATLIDTEEILSAPRAAMTLVALAREQAFDLILCGKQAGDDEVGLVGPTIAHQLGVPHLGSVSRLERTEDELLVWSEADGGEDVWEARWPLVLSVHRSPDEPRYPSVPNILKAKRHDLPVRSLDSMDLGTEVDSVPEVELVALSTPEGRGSGVTKQFDDNPQEILDEVLELLRAKVNVP